MMPKRGGRQVASRSLGVLAAMAFGIVQARDLPSRPFHIEPQPVSTALRTFASQAQLQLIFSEADVSNLTTSGVDGSLPPREALEQLLAGTPLEFEFTRRNVVVVRPARPQVASATARRGERPASSSPRAEHQRERRGRGGITPPVGMPPQGQAGARGSSGPSIDEVTVTGSRIVRRDLEAASPVLVVDQQSFHESSTLGVESVLNQLPQFVPTDTQFNTADIFPTAINTPGIGTLNLRGLGNNRTLVLIDGRRAQPANSTLVIDTNTIPASAIESVEIISGGASAAYGADALSGVTNFKLRRNFQGASVELRSGVTEVGDGEESRLSTLFGANLPDGRGNVMLGLEWMRREGAGIFGRPFFENALTDPGALATGIRLSYVSYEPSPTAGGLPSQEAANALFPERPPGTDVSRTSSFFVNPDNSLFKDAGALGYTGELGRRFKIQPNGTLGENNLYQSISSPMTRYSLFGRGHYDLSERVTLFGQVTFASADVRTIGQPSAAVGGFAASIPRDDEHPVPPELAALLDSRGPNVYSTTEFDPRTGQPLVLTGVDASWRLGRVLDFLPPRQLNNASNVYQLMAGFEGELPFSDWTWEAWVSHGETKSDAQYIGFASLERYRAVVQAPFYGRGFTLTGPGQANISCTSGLPIFEQLEVSQDCIDAITVDATDRTRLEQDILEANLQGRVFDLPAGELRTAIGASYRKNDLEFSPDPGRESSSVLDLPIGTFTNARVRGQTDVSEIYGELLVPVLRDKPFAESLGFELGLRYSDYNTSGGVPTYKALASWSPVPGVRFRGGYQLANRAPNINELFLRASSVPVTLRGPDPCRSDTLDLNGNHPGNPNRAQVQALCSAIIGTGTSTFDADPDNFIGDGRRDGGEIEVQQGNEDLESEEGQTWTFGVVLNPAFESPLLRDITVAIDWYQASIRDAISQVSAQTTYDLCFNRDGMSNPTYTIDDPNGMCRQIVRDPDSGNRLRVNSPFANLGRLETSGIDVQANWRVALADLGLERIPGSVSLNIVLNKLLEFKSQSFATSEPRENKGTLARGGLFDYRAFTTLRYIAGPANVAMTWRRLPSARSVTYVTDPTTPISGAKSYSVFNLAGSWRANDTVSLTAGIDNLFDREPNRVGASPTTNAAGVTAMTGFYDVLGRRYYLSVRLGF